VYVYECGMKVVRVSISCTYVCVCACVYVFAVEYTSGSPMPCITKGTEHERECVMEQGVARVGDD